MLIEERLAVRLMENAENNMRRAEDIRYIGLLLDRAQDQKSVFYQIVSMPQVQKILVDFLGLPQVALPEATWADLSCPDVIYPGKLATPHVNPCSECHEETHDNPK
jgi:hypothetical protein